MSGRPRRTVRRIGIAATAVVLVSGVGAWLLLATEPGLKFAWGFVEGRLPETMQVGQVSGRLLGPVELRELEYVSVGSAVEVSSVRVAWRLLPLLRKTLDIDELAVEGVRVELRPSEEVAEEALPLPTITFPLDIELVSTIVEDVVVLPLETDSEPIRLDSLSATNVSLGRDIDIGALFATGPTGWLRASGRVTPAAKYPFELEASWEVPTPDSGPLVGSASAKGDLDRIEVEALLRQPLEATLEGYVRDPMGSVLVGGHVTVSETEFRRFAAEAPEGTATVDFDFSGAVDSVRADARGQVVSPVTGPVDLEATLEWRAGKAFIERFRARLGETTIDVTGEVALLPEGPSSDLTVTWTNVRWPLQDEVQVRSGSGTARIRGTQEAFRFEGDTRVSTDAWPTAHILMRGAGTQGGAAFEDVRVETPAGRLSGHGTVGWTPEIRWDMELSGREIDTHAFLADTIPWQGLLSFEGRSTGSLMGDLLIADVTVDTLRGALGDAPVRASTSARLQARLIEGVPDRASAQLVLRWLEAEWGSNRAFASGVVGDAIRVAWTLEVPDLSVVGPEFQGSLQGLGRVTGDRTFPEFEGSITALDISTESARVAAASAEGVIETVPGGVVDIEATGAGVSFGDRTVDAIEIGVRGSPEIHDLRGTFTTSTDSLWVVASGGVEERRWTGVVERFDIVESRVGRWQLASPVESGFSLDSARVERACWTANPGELCADALWMADGSTSLSFGIDDLSGETLAASMPAGWSLAMEIDAEGSVTIADDGRLAADVQADFGSGSIQYPASGGPSELTYSTATLQLGVSESGARTAFEAMMDGPRGQEAITLAGDISLPDYARLSDTLWTQPVGGVIQAHVQDFEAINALMPQVESMAGDLRVDLEISGSVDRPEFVGEARLQDGRADLPDLGLALRDISMVARGRGLEGVVVEGGATSGTGRVSIAGEIPVAPSVESPVRLRFTGTRVQAVALPEAQVWVSPDVTITASPDQIGLAGQVRVPRAQIELSEISEAAARPSRDVVFVGEAVGARPLPSLGLDVRVELGDSVSFRGFGFSAEPRGGLVASDGPGGTMTARGEVTLTNGRYRAYGQDLTMERGRILFAGGLIENPGLDIRAARTAQDGVVAGLEVAGTLRRPEVTIFSEPPMMESEALAYIVLGRPLGTASTTEGNRVANAAASLGIREGNVLAGRIAQRFGLAEVRIAADGPLEEASLVAGKYLSPQLYVSYGVGLFEPISTFRLRYLLSGRWTLQAESGRSTGADLLYRIERGR